MRRGQLFFGATQGIGAGRRGHASDTFETEAVCAARVAGGGISGATGPPAEGLADVADGAGLRAFTAADAIAALHGVAFQRRPADPALAARLEVDAGDLVFLVRAGILVFGISRYFSAGRLQ